jgi:hypothetical protein
LRGDENFLFVHDVALCPPPPPHDWRATVFTESHPMAHVGRFVHDCAGRMALVECCYKFGRCLELLLVVVEMQRPF